MAQYIDKSVLVAEIERRIKAIPRGKADKRLKAVHAAVYGNEAFVLMCLLSFINKLEVKEVEEKKRKACLQSQQGCHSMSLRYS